VTTAKKKFDHIRYLSTQTYTDRMAVLADMKKTGARLPASLSEDLMLLDISNIEKQAILEVTSAHDNKSLEHFLTINLADWDQDLAATAIRVWSRETDHLLWSRLYELCQLPHTPQRVLYTIVDLACDTGGLGVIDSAARHEALAEMSDAFKGLVLHRASQWNLKSDRLIALAQSVTRDLGIHLHPDNKALPSALAYLARYAPASLKEIQLTGAITETWKDLVRTIAHDLEAGAETATRTMKQISGARKTARAALLSGWLPSWSRHHLNKEQLKTCLSLFFSEEVKGTEARPLFVNGPWEFFGGFDDNLLCTAMMEIADDATFCRALASLQGLIKAPTPEALRDQIRSRIGSAQNPAEFLTRIPLRLRLELTENPNSKVQTPFSRIEGEQSEILAGRTPAKRCSFSDYDGSEKEWTCPEDKKDFTQRRSFFDVAYRNKKPDNAAGAGYFSVLAAAYTNPDDKQLGQIAKIARQESGVMRLCYLNTIGRFKGMDQAALKTLDFIRSKEEDDLRAIMNALAGIGTPRATQELVSSLTRPNVTPQLQMEICGHLAKTDVSNLQNELRSALNDLNVTPDVESDKWDIRDAIAALLAPTEAAAVNSGSTQSFVVTPAAGDPDLDQSLSGLIPGYKELSSEVKRALRTSLFFHQQVSAEHAPTSIDLSPVIDMQYKAMELLFREAFEDHCSKIIHRGVLQRKLDIIGYARPIPRAMDDFENYVASLPTVRDIPFFSKFKLRKMLRAICQFRPGRRFTLDGLKAFALFFLCFGRRECRYGLAGLFETPYTTDAELFDFCKTLHIFQDFRNRAAHEGFHPDAANDIDGIWRHTAEIVQNMWKLEKFIQSNGGSSGGSGTGSGSYSTPTVKSNPVIEKKVS
jgi:hypothetical protein